VFRQIYDQYNWEQVKDSIYAKTSKDVIEALNKKKHDLEDFKALIAPAALPFLEQMASQSQQLTQQRFGKTIQMYIPLYLSNECQNICTYCGFSYDNPLKRNTLTDEQIKQEIAVIKSYGYDHILLVTGEANKTVGLGYFKNALKIIRPHFSHIAMEVQPLEKEDYNELIRYGLNTVLVYQETYNKQAYKNYHLKGKKRNFYYRLDTPDRLGQAGIHKIGLGCLIGLDDWRSDSFFTALHLNYLEKHYWKTKYSISFPRLRPFSGSLTLPSPKGRAKIDMSDRELVQLICAYRIFNQEVELSMSTRESEKFRNNIIPLGITSMSAGSKTNPGGYTANSLTLPSPKGRGEINVNGDNPLTPFIKGETLEQFEICDERTPAQVVEAIKEQDYEPVWKDWDNVLIDN